MIQSEPIRSKSDNSPGTILEEFLGGFRILPVAQRQGGRLQKHLPDGAHGHILSVLRALRAGLEIARNMAWSNQAMQINYMGLKHQVEIAKKWDVPTLPELVEGKIFMKPLFRCQKQCFLKQLFSQMVFFKQIHGMLLGCISTNVLIHRLCPHVCLMIFHIWVGHGWSKNGARPKIHVVSQHLPCSNWNFRWILHVYAIFRQPSETGCVVSNGVSSKVRPWASDPYQLAKCLLYKVWRRSSFLPLKVLHCLFEREVGSASWCWNPFFSTSPFISCSWLSSRGNLQFLMLQPDLLLAYATLPLPRLHHNIVFPHVFCFYLKV